MQALDEDQPGPAVDWAKIFEEDREFNQGVQQFWGGWNCFRAGCACGELCQGGGSCNTEELALLVLWNDQETMDARMARRLPDPHGTGCPVPRVPALLFLSMESILQLQHHPLPRQFFTSLKGVG